MPNYTQLFVQLVFAVSHRDAMITETIEPRLYAYMSGVIEKRKCKVIAIGGMPDHVHILVHLHPTASISDLVRDIKSNSSLFINDNRLMKRRFEWQANYAAFSYSRSQVPRVKAYIRNQKEHHKKRTFRDEILWMFNQFGIEYKVEFGFTWLDAREGRPLRGDGSVEVTVPGVSADAPTPGYTSRRPPDAGSD